MKAARSEGPPVIGGEAGGSAAAPGVRRRRMRFGGGFALLLAAALALVAIAAPSASAAPFGCSSFAYLFQSPEAEAGPHSIEQVDLATGKYTHFASTPFNVNAVGYNELDGYMWGMQLTSPAPGERESNLVRINADGSLEEFPWPAGIPHNVAIAIGDVDNQGHYLVAQGERTFLIDLAPGSPTFGTLIGEGEWKVPAGLKTTSDIAFINGAYYGVMPSQNMAEPAHLLRYTLAGGIEDLGVLPGVPSDGGTPLKSTSYGAVYADAAGYLYASNNLSGEIYRVNLATKESIPVSEGPISNGNDGARCASAPIPTITVSKLVQSRAAAADQFTVGLAESTGRLLDTATTSGAGTTASTTNWPVSEGSTYTITDAMASGSPTPLNQYIKSIVCKDGEGNTVAAGGSAPNWTLTVAKATSYTCTVINKAEADLAIEKTAASRLVPGKPATYTLKATNKGPSTATNVVVSDQLPSGETFVSASNGCTESGGKVSCDVASLAVGASQTFEVNVKAASAAKCSELSNTATISSSVPDPDQGNNSSTVRDCGPRSDLEIKKAASSAKVLTNGQIMYTLVVTNKGPSDNTNVTVTDPMAAGLALESAKPSQGKCSTADGKVSCNLGDLVSGGSAHVLVTAKVTAHPAPGSACGNGVGQISNKAEVIGDGFDPDQANNSDVAGICVPPPPAPPAPGSYDLAIKKTVNHKSIKADGKVTYKLAVTNNGPATAPGVKVTDTFNHRGKVVSVKTTAGSCIKAMPMSCSLGDMASGAKVTIRVVVKPLSTGCKQRNAASVTGEGTDSNPKDNLSRVGICVAPRLAIEKTVDHGTVEAGGIVHYTIRVTNRSKKIAAQDVRTCDRMPSGLAYLGSRPKARISHGVPCWTKKVLKGRKSVVYHVTAKVLRSAGGTLRNVATTRAAGSKGKALGDVAAVRVQAKAPKPTPVTG